MYYFFRHVLNFAPWFTKQPMVESINTYLVTLDYFHTTHFMAYHRRAAVQYLEKYEAGVKKG